MPLFRSALFALPVAALALSPVAMAQAQPAAMDDAQRAAIETVVRDYLMKNPEIILQAVEALQQREKMAEAERSKAALAANQQALTRSPADPVAGNPQGDVTVVEFFDYQCGYCKAVQADTQRLIKDDPKLRFVFKELPILGPASVVASKAALASKAQGKYLEFHNALMAQRGQLDEEVILRLAKSVGLDTDRLKKDMESRDVLSVIAANQALAEQLGIHGTPGFVFGTELVPGAIKLEDMKRMVAATRAKG
ncbi:DsbA family protein [Azospirillum doebereinerae]|uniref:DsbA family protein n=1 Tax=Azospirillum doebereinerae TaxID=92933 RepID=A0A433JDQ5_9PROT|nr:DsbA family protein [Azospirillum doebereinerae]MCG5239970.1 DsbA family protein [Azospirillum doebereinerae]RUQ75028.1 DsbA family protein [Azospirillum doebereinerae]